MKVVKVYDGNWDIMNNDDIVGRIEHRSGIGGRSGRKTLYVDDKDLGYIDNQKEAIEKIEKFFDLNKRDIKAIDKTIEELKADVFHVKNDCSSQALQHEITRKLKELENLKRYDLI